MASHPAARPRGTRPFSVRPGLCALALALAACGAAASGNDPAATPAASAPQSTGEMLFAPGIAYERRHVDYEVQADGSYTKTTETIRRVLNDNGVREAAQTSIAYSASLQQLEVLQAQVITPDGKTLDVPASAIFEQEPYASQAAPSFSDFKVRTLVFPQVTPDSRLIVRTRLTQRQPLLPGQFSMLEFVSPHSQRQDFVFTVTAPASLPLAVQNIDLDASRSVLPDGRVRLQFSGANSNAVAPDAGSVQRRDYSPRVALSTMADGAALAQAYRALTPGSTEPTPQVRALAEQLTAGLSEPRAQAKALYDWVRQNIRYVSIVLERGGLVPRSLDSILANRYGDCKDHASLLSALLQARGIDSTQVLVNAGNAYWMPEPGMVDAFNHMILYLPGQDLYLDSTAQYAAFGELPSQDAGKAVLHVASGQWAHTPLGQNAITRMRQRIEVADSGDARVQSRFEYEGEEAIFMRALFGASASIPDDRWVPTLLQSIGVQGEGQLQRADTRAQSPGATARLDYSARQFMELPGPGALRMPPLALGSVEGALNLLARQRRYPYPCPSFRAEEQLELHLPASVQVRRDPPEESIKLSLPGVDFHYRASAHREGQVLHLTREVAAENRQAVCQPGDFAAQQDFAARMRRNLRAQLLYD